ncbi:MAG: hypothetical protein MJE68_16805 [Proteobacteria bacterium]|nr:hypothetical protein [Pseudomonadota bacterium]
MSSRLGHGLYKKIDRLKNIFRRIIYVTNFDNQCNNYWIQYCSTSSPGNGFAIHSVPFDGDSLFTSVGYQLEPRVDKNTFQRMVVNHLDKKSHFYKGFLSQPVTSHDAYNADTEPPTAQDTQIEMIANHELQAELRWDKYIQRLKDAWGDYIAIPGICDMFNVTVNVLSSQNSNMIPILPGTRLSKYWMMVTILSDDRNQLGILLLLRQKTRQC